VNESISYSSPLVANLFNLFSFGLRAKNKLVNRVLGFLLFHVLWLSTLICCAKEIKQRISRESAEMILLRVCVEKTSGLSPDK